jgi:signal transduction histidine kinase/ActR/RegA family two-component response regulator
LKANAKVLGIMNVATRRPVPFKPREVELLTAIGNIIGVAVQNAQLFVEVKRSYEELKRAQGQLIQAEKLTALGQMAGGVAHDFNNILAAILGRTQLLIRQVEEPQVKNWLRVIERASLDGAETVRRIQEFTRQRSDEEPESVDLNELIDDVVKITEVRWKDDAQAKGIRIDVDVEPGRLLPVVGNPSELREVLINVVLNALDAMPRGGRLMIRTGIVADSSPRVEVVISDDGLGMSEEIRRKVFDPFFTTKGPRSTGLGMSVAYGIIHRHKGEIQVESQEGRGSSFRIRLPVAAEAVGPPESLVPLPSDVRVKILVIDDEDGVREALRDMLLSSGAEVEIHRNGRDGLRAFERDQFDIVFTDLGMPDVSGWQVAEAVKARRPGTPVVLVTGWGVQVGRPDRGESAVDLVLPKPFRVDDALKALGHALELSEERKQVL